MADIKALAGTAYNIGVDDPELVANWRNERKTLANSMLTDSSFGTAITSATVNGQSYAGATILSNAERLMLLNIVLRHIDAGVPPSSRSYARF